MFALSPTNMALFRQCPRKFFGQYVKKDIVYKESPSRKRGLDVHNAVEQYIQGQSDVLPGDINATFTKSKVSRLQALGGTVLVEQDLAVKKDFQPVTFFDPEVWLRARADVVVVCKDAAHLVDIKTGKKWDNDAFQLRIEAMLVMFIYKVSKIDYEYWYVDSAETVRGIVDFSTGIAAVADIVRQIKNMERAMEQNNFAPTQNKFCKWCDYYETSRCGL